MRTKVLPVAMAVAGMMLGATPVWAHPGHLADGGVWRTVTHALASPYHIAVLVGVVALSVGWTMALRGPGPSAAETGEAREDAA